MSKVLKEKQRAILLIIILSLITYAIYRVAGMESFHSIKENLEQNAIIYMPLLVLIKIIAVLYPPLPGMAATVGSVAIYGWKVAYTLDLIGSVSGATGAYFLGKKYGKKILLWVIGEKLTKKITSIKTKQTNQIETTFMLRVASGGVLSDGIAWGASLIKLRYFPFLVGYVLSHIITSLPVFFLLGQSTEIKTFLFSLPIILFVWLVLYKFKGRYFE